MKKIKLFLTCFFCLFLVVAKSQVSGLVANSSDKSPLQGASITVTGTNVRTQTNAEGKFSIAAKSGDRLTVTMIGFETTTISVGENVTLSILLKQSTTSLSDVIVSVGSRNSMRTIADAPIPIDVLSSKDLLSTGQITFDKALQFRVPSFNTVQTPVNDATSLLDPYEIRNMGPSRTLILINGKRKNLSSLVYVQTGPGRGETGADISAIPTDAIERVEILRDGASAQYGSDAIAGVMNIILKKKSEGGAITVRTGATGKGDGENFGLSINNGSTVGNDGFINYTIDFSKTELANRPGIVSAVGEANYWGGTTVGVNRMSDIQSFLAKKPDAGNINGSPETAASKFLVNGGRKLSANTEMYFNAAYIYKKVNSYANYRTPYWRTAIDFPYLKTIFGDGTLASYQGYVPTFQGELSDFNATLGYKYSNNGWNADASITTGGNQQNYTVGGSHNRSSGSAGLIYAINPNVYTGPVSFNPGGVGFNHYVGNIDINKAVSDKFNISFGSEVRTETFEVRAGDEASYVGVGADSYQGNHPDNSGKFNRYNIGYYAGFSADLSENFLIDGTFRTEDYSDFGSKSVWKISSRYKLMDEKLILRGSISTGFRAPTLHQIYTQKVQSSFGGGGIQLEGISNNVSAAARQYGVPNLKAESSTNSTFGVAMKFSKNFTATVDYYDISVKDRIVLGDKIVYSPGNIQSFFTNSIDTKTSGVDVVASLKGLALGSGKLAINYAANFTLKNELDGPVRNIPSVVALNQNVFGATQEALLLTSRPKFKHIIGLDYSNLGKWTLSLNNTVFGKSKFKNADLYDPKKLTVEFLTKVVTDLGVSYNASEKVTLALNINNILNVLPKWQLVSDTKESVASILTAAAGTYGTMENQINDLTFNGRYSQMTYDGSHFSQLGAMWNFTLVFKF